MQFDIVIGNPPYSRGSDIDFIATSYDITTKFVCMVVPAKWQTSDPNQRIQSKITYGQFREAYSEHISHIVFYPYCNDVFNIMQVDGITYFLMDKSTHQNVIIENNSVYFPELNTIEIRPISSRQTLLNMGNRVLNTLPKGYETFKFPLITKTKRYQVWVNIQIPGGGLGVIKERRRVMLVGDGVVVDTHSSTPYISGDAEQCIYESDNKSECFSLLSYINTRFVQFFLLINQSKLTGILTDDIFRYVPKPPDGFNRIYTDEYLYNHFSLCKEHTQLIEALIKPRNTPCTIAN